MQRIIDKLKIKIYLSVTAYSKFLENNLEYLESKINLNIGIRYSKMKIKL